jgi:hypothetical protein
MNYSEKMMSLNDDSIYWKNISVMDIPVLLRERRAIMIEDRIMSLIANLALLENEILKLPDNDENQELFRLNDEIQNGMLILFEDYQWTR